MDFITSLTDQVMNKALDGLAKRHTVITSNLANVDTPNYHRSNVFFEEQLTQAIETAHGKNKNPLNQTASNNTPLAMQASSPQHFGRSISIDDVEPEITEMKDLAVRQDGNSVDIDTEMAQLARNTQRFLALSNLESRAIKSMRSIINGG